MFIEEAKTCVISTAHLPAEEASSLTHAFNGRNAMGFLREEGFMVYHDNRLPDLPCLSFILGYMKAKGYDWVMFDRDAGTLPVFESFQW